MAEEKKENIVKRVCKELNLTYKQLGERIGYSENAVSNASRGDVSKTMNKAIQLYLKISDLEKELKDLNTLRNTLKSILN